MPSVITSCRVHLQNLVRVPLLLHYFCSSPSHWYFMPRLLQGPETDLPAFTSASSLLNESASILLLCSKSSNGFSLCSEQKAMPIQWPHKWSEHTIYCTNRDSLRVKGRVITNYARIIGINRATSDERYGHPT